MKKVLLYLLMALLVPFATLSAQETITLTGNVTQELTSGGTYTFYDSGGPTGNYGTSESYTATFTADGAITINFTSLATESSSSCGNWDYMLIYDGDATSGTLLGRAQTGCSSAMITTEEDYVAESGTMTIEWHSDGTVTAAGWVATISVAAAQGGPTCEKPETAEVTDITSNSATFNVSGGSQTYNVEIKGGAYADWTFVLKGTTNTAIALSDLTPNTSYQVRAQSVCDGGATSGYKQASFKTLIGLPYLEQFGTTTIPSGWSRYEGLLNDDGSATLTTSSSYWVFGTFNDVFDSHAKIEVYSTRKAWLVTPSIPMIANQQLTFNLALTHWTGSGVPAPQNPQPDARFIVLATLDGGANWVTLREWNNTGSQYVFDNIICSAEGEEVTIDLSAYGEGQTIQIGFYVYHSTGGDNNLHIDNVQIAAIPTCKIPESLDAVPGRTTKNTVQLGWTAKSEETAWVLEYKKATDENYTSLDITENPYTLANLDEFTEYTVRIAANCDPLSDVIGEGISKWSKPVAIKTASGVPFVQSFDTVNLPAEWKRYEALLSDVINEGAELEATSDGWDVKAANDIFPSADEHLVLNLTGDATKYWIVGPTIEMEENQQLTFDLAFTKAAGGKVGTGTQNSQKFYTFITANGGLTWTELGKWTNSGDGFSLDGIKTEGQMAKFDLTAYAANSIQIAFYAESTVETDASNNLHIANVKIDAIPACSKATSLDITGVQGTVATAVWEADEEGTWQYGYVVKPAGEFVPADSLFMGTTTAMTFAMTDLVETTHYLFFVRRVCGENDYSEVLVKEFATIQTPAELPYSHDFESGNGWLLVGSSEIDNHWVWNDNADANNTANGSKALYISNDNFGTYEYSRGTGKAATVYAAKTFYFDQPGMYSFQYDWKCLGYSTYDYLRVALVPANVEWAAATTLPSGLTTTALPTGWEPLDGGSRLNLSNEWNHELYEVAVDEVGYYQVVFIWRNNTYTSTTYGNPPAAVDNIKIARIKCTKPTQLAVSAITAESATFSWAEVEGASFEYAIVAADEEGQFAEPTEFTEVPELANSIQVTGLTAQTAYKFYVRKACGGEDGNSDAISIEFKTECASYSIAAQGAYTEGFEDYTGVTYSAQGVAPDCWTTGGTSTYAAPHVVVSGGSYAWAHEGTNGLNFCASSSSYQYAMLPIFAEELNTLQISFWARMENATNGTLSLGYITSDSETIQPIASFPSVTGTMTKHELLLSDVPAEATRLVFVWNHTGSSYYSCCIDDITVEEIPSCMKPTNLAAVDSLTTNSSVTITWTPGANENYYLLQYKLSTDTVWSYVPDSVILNADTTFTLTGLEAAKVYNVRMASWCDTADSTAISEYSAAISVATLCEPYSIADKGDFIEGFEAYEGTTYAAAGVVPVCWETGGTSTYAAPHVVAKGTYAYVHEGNQALNFCASASSNAYAVLPEFADSLHFLQISFWAQMENASNGTLYLGYIDTTATFRNLTSFANHTGSMEYYEAKLNTVPASAVRLAFVWDHTGTSYYSCCIDDIKISYIPDCVKPENVATIESLTTANSVTLTWEAQGEETAWAVQYKLSTDTVWTSVAADNDTILIEGLKPASYYDVQVAAVCGETETSEYSLPAQFVTGCALITEFPVSENFDQVAGVTSGHVLPLCWSSINECTYSTYSYYPTVYKGATYANSGTNSLRFYSYNYVSSSSSTNYDPQDQYAILPEMEGVSGLRMRFNARAYSTGTTYDATFTVGVMTDPADSATFVPVVTLKPKTTTYEPFAVMFNKYGGAGKYIAIKMEGANPSATSYHGAYIDDIVIDPIPTCFEPDSLQVTLTNGNGSVATLNWAAGAASAWEVQYGMKADFAGALSVSANEPTINLTDLTSDSTYYARVKAICSETDQSEWSAAISFVPSNDFIINDSTATNSYIPVYGSYVDDGIQSQFIIPEAEIASLQWDSITQLTFYASTASAAWANTQFEVYVAEAPATTLSSMEAWSNMTKVMNAKHLEIANKQMVVTLDKPFQYQGGNLLIGIKQTVTGTYNGCTWYGKTGVSGNSMYQYGTNSATKSTFNPKMKIDHVAGEMPSCFVVKNIGVSDITASSAVLNWTKGEESQNAWQIAIDSIADFNPNTAELIAADANVYALTGLETETTYYVYVRANCSDAENEDYSKWSEVFTFQTASACQTPSDIEFSEITATSASISWNTYGQTGFNLLYSDGTVIDTIYDVNSPYVLEGLTAKTQYGVKVQAACAAENVWSQMSTFKTAYGIPFEEKFDELTAFPTDWTRYSGVVIDDVLAGTATLSTPASSGWNFSSSTTGVFASKHMYVNIWSTYKYWAVLPAVMTENDDVQLSFTMALSKSSSAYNSAIATNGTDDKFVILASVDDGATWTVLREWSNDSTAEYVYNNIATNDEEVVINLSQYKNQSLKIAFYGASTVSNADNYLHIDNVLIDRVPSCIKPNGLNISEIKAHTAKVAWTAGAEDQIAWQIAYDTIASNRPDTLANVLDVTENPYVLTDLAAAHTYYVYVRANCGEQDGYSKWTDAKSFRTTLACPAPKNLEAVLTPGNGSVATLNWVAGAEEAAWIVEYSTNANMSDSIVVAVEDTTLALEGLTAETTYYARVKADCGELDGTSAYSAIVSFKPTAAYLLTVNDGTATNSYVPIYGSYVDDETQRSQFIIPEAALEGIEWVSIKSLTFYASAASINWGAATFEVYLAETPEATLDAEADWAAMTKVMNAASLSVVENKMVITLDAAYQYQGGNLMIGIKQGATGTWKSASWYGVTANGASFGGYGTSTNFVQRNFLPKMTIEYVPGVAPACPNPKNLQVLSVSADSASFSWKAVEGAAWEYAVALASATEPAEFIAVEEGANSIEIGDLEAETAYVFYLRRACGEDGYSDVLSVGFTTEQIIAAVPFAEDFEEAQAWKFVNDATNAWMIGNATSNGGGNALYISNNGADYAYDEEASTASFATKLISFDIADTTYVFEYDWKAVGEYNDEDGAIDYLRVGLVPAATVLTAGNSELPATWIALDGDSALYGEAEWQHKRVELAVEPGLYKIVFVWINDDADSDGDPAAIDNISISIKPGTGTGIDGNNAIENKAVKFIHNNQVYIRINGVVYNITGQKVEVK